MAAEAEQNDHAATADVPAAPPRRRLYHRKSAVVLEAAERVFLQTGFASTSMDDIAVAAGVSKRTVYSNFGNKEELFAAVIRKRCAHVVPDDAIVAEAADLDVEAGLNRLAVAFLTSIFARSQVELYQTVVAAARKRPEMGQAMYEGPISQSQHIIAGYLARQVDAGRLVIADPDAAAAQLIALIKTNIHMRLLLNQPVDTAAQDIADSAASSIRLFLYGCAPR